VESGRAAETPNIEHRTLNAEVPGARTFQSAASAVPTPLAEDPVARTLVPPSLVSLQAIRSEIQSAHATILSTHAGTTATQEVPPSTLAFIEPAHLAPLAVSES
jgi:hypothetical protein